MNGAAWDRVLEAATINGLTIQHRGSGQCMVQCPAHEDRVGSLSMSRGEGKVLLNCHAGCHVDDVVAGLGMTMTDLFDEEPSRSNATVTRSYVYETWDGKPWMIVDRYFPKDFRQRRPGTPQGDRSGLKGRQPVLYHLPRLEAALRAAQTAGTTSTVWVVEGEKDVETCERHGLVATTAPMGAGKWLDSYSHCLKRFDNIMIVADQDPPKQDGSLGPGQQHAVAARESLKAHGARNVIIVRPAAGKDATDHFAAGHGVEDFAPDRCQPQRRRGVTGADLETRIFKPITYAVQDILPDGLAILAGGPKVGKSWIALDIGLGVAAGGRAMSALTVTQGSVLYLAREDTDRRLQSRCELILDSDTWPKHIEFHSLDVEWPSGVEGLARMTEWAEEVGDPRLVVVDTFAKVEPDMEDEQRKGKYLAEYGVLARYKQWADSFGCTVLLVHHDRKAASEDDDWTMKISGSRAITGAVDTIMLLDAKRGAREGHLHITGRDVADQSLEIRKVGPLWLCSDLPQKASGLSTFSQELVGYIYAAKGATLRDAAVQFPEAPERKLRTYMDRFVRSGLLVREGAAYVPNTA